VVRDDFILRTERDDLCPLIDEIVALANAERNALGFLPVGAYQAAIDRKRLLALVRNENGRDHLVGFALYSGVKTAAKVQQIATSPEYRRQGIARALMRALIDALEKNHFLSVQADVASDLDHAKAFYQANEFKVVSQRTGGASKGRTILVHARFLETPSLFDFTSGIKPEADWSLPKEFDVAARTFALDVMVYIDLVRDRGFREHAEKLFRSALSHEIRIAVADEFCAELKNAGRKLRADPLYSFALQLPNLAPVNEERRESLANNIYDAVFVDSRVRGYGKPSSRRDSRHLAHAVLAGADAFVTRENSFLNASGVLLSKFDLDVMSPEELVAYLPRDLSSTNDQIQGDGFTVDPATIDEAKLYLKAERLSAAQFPELENFDPKAASAAFRIIKVDKVPKACSVLITTRHTSPITRALIHVKPEAMDGALYSEVLLNESLRTCSERAVSAIQFVDLPGQTIVRAGLRNSGFVWNRDSNCYEKVVVGRPVLPEEWSAVVVETRRRAGIVLPKSFPSFASSWRAQLAGPNGHAASVNFKQLEALIGPVIIAAEDRPAVIVPIQKAYSEMLLGEGAQMLLGLTENKDAQFQGQRAYVGSAKRPKLFEKGGLLFFYESSGGAGAGAIVAVSRIVDSLITTDISEEDRKKIVVDDLSQISVSDRVLLTRFDNIFRLDVPVTFSELKKMGVPDGTNFVTATGVSPDRAIGILRKGKNWT